MFSQLDGACEKLLVPYIVKRQKLIFFFKKHRLENDDETKYSTFYSSSKAEKICNKSDIDDLFESIYSTIVLIIQKSLAKVWVKLLIQS